MRAICGIGFLPIRDLALETGLTIAEGRAEALVAELVGRHGEFDVAVARAAGVFESIAPIALDYVKPGGLFVMTGSPPSKSADKPPGSAAKWELRRYPELGLERSFLVTKRPA